MMASAGNCIVRCLAYVLLAASLFAQARVNCGGPSIADGMKIFFADTFTTTGAAYVAPVLLTGVSPIYSTLRYGTFTYDVPAVSGSYNVTLHFAETSVAISNVGQRLMNIRLQGQTVLSNFDVFLAAGGHSIPITRTFRTESIGTIKIEFITVLRNAIVSAIEVEALQPSATQAKQRAELYLLSAPVAASFRPRQSVAPGTLLLVHRNGLLQSLDFDYTLCVTPACPQLEVRFKPECLPQAGDSVKLTYWTDSGVSEEVKIPSIAAGSLRPTASSLSTSIPARSRSHDH
jgi:hypothetical protein